MSFPTEEKWAEEMKNLIKLLDLGELNAKALEYIAYENVTVASNPSEPTAPQNVYCDTNGIKVEMATIHAVKGETHDATLVCETKYSKWFDIQEMLELMCDAKASRPVFDPEHPSTKDSIRATFMKKLYVGMTRPRYLLCLAINKSNVTASSAKYLSEVSGWRIVEVSNAPVI